MCEQELLQTQLSCISPDRRSGPKKEARERPAESFKQFKADANKVCGNTRMWIKQTQLKQRRPSHVCRLISHAEIRRLSQTLR